MNDDPYRLFLRAIRDRGLTVHESGGSTASVQCPVHDDTNASATVSRGARQPVVFNCNSLNGCTYDDAVAALGLDKADLAARDDKAVWTPYGDAVAVYRYRDEAGQLLYEVCRTADKQFPVRVPDPATRTGWRWKFGNARRVLYRLPELLAVEPGSRPIYVTEGEKDANAIVATGNTATTAPGGAKAFLRTDPSALAGHYVYAVVDRDAAGDKWAADVEKALRPIVKDIRFVRSGTGKDAHDHLSAGLTIDAFVPYVPAAEEFGDYLDGQAAVAPEPEPEPRVNSLRGKLLSLADLRKLPPARPLIKGILDLDSESWLIGASGEFKSFVAIDWTCHVATGKPWRGHKVTQGSVLYVCAEGTKSFAKRVDAWQLKNGAVPDALIVLPEPVQAKGANDFGDIKLSREWLDLIEIAAEIQPVLIVLDTQARMTLGLSENDNGQMGVWINAVSELKRATKACVLVVHHTGRGGGDARGASAIDAAQDTEWKMERVGGKHSLKARLSLEKNKDGDDRVSFSFHMQVVTVGLDEDGAEITSLVLGDEAHEDFEKSPARLTSELANSFTQQSWLLGYMRLIGDNEAGYDEGMTSARIKAGLPRFQKDSGVTVPLDGDAIDKARNKLVGDGLLTNLSVDGKERRGWCRLTDAGLRAAPDLAVFQTSLETSLDLEREV